MRRNSRTSYQLLTSAFILTVGSVVGVVAIRIWEGMLLDQALESRKAIVRGIELAGAGREGDRTGEMIDALAREGFGVAGVRFLTDGAGESPAVRETLGRADTVAWRDGGRLLVSAPFRRSGVPDERLLVEFDMAGVDANMRRIVLHVLGLVGTLALVNFLTVGWLVRRWMHPIGELSRKMDDVQRGDLTVAVPEDRSDEIGDLARHFNAMVEAIRKARQQSIELARRQANIEKFAALGRLSSGVVHEINNPVGGILTALAVLRDIEPGSKRYDEYLDMMRVGLERVSSIVGQLLRFARQPREERKDLNLNALLEEVSVLARLQYRANRLHVVRRFGDIPPVSGAPDLLNQLFLNLAMNSFQEMPDGGILTITTRAEEGRVLIAFEDTGPGIPEENLERIFEPFFTTKAVGEGTGLGLSVALGIVEAHGGTVEAGNRPEGGARFTIRLPIQSRETEATKSTAKEPE